MTSTSCALSPAAGVDEEVLRWIHFRVGEYVASKVRHRDQFYRRWDIRNLVYNITQLLDYTVQTCLYLAVNNNRRTGGTQRNHSVVGFNRNPVESVAARATRCGAKGPKNGGWTLLVYIVMGKRDFSVADMCEFAGRVSSLKCIESKILEIVKFGIAHSAPVRIDHNIFNPESCWFMPKVQRCISKHKSFIEYTHRLRAVTGRGPTPQSARP